MFVTACISPADSNAEETINTLKYANRARNIQNKAVINRDPASIEMQKLRIQLEQMQSEVLFYRGSGASFEEVQILREKITLLEARNVELQKALKEHQITSTKHALNAQVEKDKQIMMIESSRGGKPWDEIDYMENTQDLDLLSGYVSSIQDLETELLRYQNSCIPSQNGFMDCLPLEKDPFLPSIHDLGCVPDGRTVDDSSEADDDEKEREHSSLQDILGKELQELDKRLEQKEAEKKMFAKVDTSVLRQHYEKKLMELEQEKKVLQKEIEQLRFNLANISSTSGDSAQQLKEEYLHKLTLLESQVLQRKTEEASMATKRLRDLLEAKKASSREASGGGQANNPGILALMQAIEHELEVTVRVHEVRSEFERQMQEKAAMAKEVVRLKEESENSRQKILSECPQTMSPSVRNSRIAALENMLATSSSTLVYMASELSEAEERERLFSGRDVRSLVEAKKLMYHLFNLAASLRCHLRDMEVICREKDSFIGELKEKVYRLSILDGQIETQKAAPNEINKKGLQKSIIFNHAEVVTVEDNFESDEDWVDSVKFARKRRSKRKKFDTQNESAVIDKEGHMCCSCSKISTCKTKRCECRVLNSSCNAYCGCNALKCANREDNSYTLEDVKTRELVSQGALLLQSALNERPNTNVKSNTLSEIGNSQVILNSDKPLKRKNWRKTNIQLVPKPLEPPVPDPQPKEAPDRDEIRLRLPRAMETAMTQENHPPFSDMNSVRSDETMGRSKENRGIAPPRSPVKLRNASDEKENSML